MLELHVLRSGDRGSCYAVRPQGAQEFICVDCGINGKTFAEACMQAGLVPFKLQAFLITHAHGKQTQGLKSTLTWLIKRGVNPPVYVAPSVLEASKELSEVAGMADLRELEALHPLDFGRVHVLPFRTFHNNEDKGGCYNFRFEERAGGEGQQASDVMTIVSDAGALSKQAQSALEHARLIAMECNYDQALVEKAAQDKTLARWPETRGNFSNGQAANAVKAYAWEGLRDVVAMYLSRTNNTPELARQALEAAVRASGCDARVACASPDEVVSVLPRGGAAEASKEAKAGEAAASSSASTTADEPASSSERADAYANGAASSSVPAGAKAGGAASSNAPAGAKAGAVASSDNATEALRLLSINETATSGEAESADGDKAAIPSEAAEPIEPATLTEFASTVEPTTAEAASNEQTNPSAPAAECTPEPAATPAEASPEPATFEDILALPQAREAGMADVKGLLEAWEAQGCTCNPTPEETIDVFAALGLLDPQDLSPTDVGVAAGVWVAFDPEDPTGALFPVFSLAQAKSLRALIEG